MTDHPSTTVTTRRTGMLVWWATLTLSALTCFLGVFALALSGVQEHRAQRLLYSELRGALDPSSPLAPPVGGMLTHGRPLFLLTAEKAGLNAVVVSEGTTSSMLMSGPGHLANTALPGQPGQSMIFGKSVTAGAPFAHLGHLRAGDHLSVTTAQGTFDFVVLGQRHEGEPLPILPPSRSMVTLVTASGSGLFGALSPTSLLYVDAALNGNAVRAPAGRPETVAFDELQGQGESGAVFAVIIWLLLLAVVAVGAVLLVERWGLGRSWLLVAPVVLSVLWGLSTNVLHLLPNVY